MKRVIAAIALALAAGSALAVAHAEGPAQPQFRSAVVIEAGGVLAVKVDKQLLYLNGVAVLDAAGRRSDARLAAGTPVTFLLGPEGSSPRIREVRVAR